MISWIGLNKADQLEEIISRSSCSPVIIFKHSTRCSISSIAKMRLESHWTFDNEDLPAYILDLIAYRQISNLIAEKFDINHESPQLILIKNGECVYDASHFDITVDELEESLIYIKTK